MGRIKTLFQAIVILSLVTAVAWQVEGIFEDPTRDAFQNADRRLRGEGPGEKKNDRQGLVFEVPRGTDTLRVGSVIDVDGSVTFVLRDPRGNEHRERLDGDTFSKNCCWKRIPHPVPGTWELDVYIRGEGAYVLGFYFEDGD